MAFGQKIRQEAQQLDVPATLNMPDFSNTLLTKLKIMVESYSAVTGNRLLDDPTPIRLWHAPCVIVAHGTEAEPVFFYGNRMALELFEMDFAHFTRLPSRHSAEPVERQERARLLEQVSRDGFIDNYAGVRISATGKRFRIEQAVVWNLVDGNGGLHGQAATFDRWRPI